MSFASPSVRAGALLVAGGSSARLFASGHLGPVKQLVELEPGRPLFLYALEALERAATIAQVVLVHRGEDRAAIASALARRAEAGSGLGKLAGLVEGGRERQDSVRLGLAALDPSLPLVAIHDAARPLISPERIDACVLAAAAHGAALLAVPLVDTIKRSSDGRFAAETLERRELWAAQTPQCFDSARFRALIQASAGPALSDDAGLWERAHGPVALVEGERQNFKITHAEDLEWARAWLRARAAPGGTRSGSA